MSNDLQTVTRASSNTGARITSLALSSTVYPDKYLEWTTATPICLPSHTWKHTQGPNERGHKLTPTYE